MTGPSMSDLRAAYEAWLTKPTRTRHLRTPEPHSDGPREMDIFSFEEDGDEPIAFIATCGMSTFEINAPSRRIELVLPISARIDDAQFEALAKWLGELATVPFRQRSSFAPNVIAGRYRVPVFDGKSFVLLADFKIRAADYLPMDEEVRLLRVTPLTEAEAAIARDIGDADTYQRFQLEGIQHQDPKRPEAKLGDPVPASIDPPTGEPTGEPIDEIWKAIEDWLRAHAGPTLDALRPGADDTAIADLERAIGVSLPADYRASLKRHDGRAYLTDYEYLSIARIVSVWQSKQKALDEGTFIGREVNDKGGGVVRDFWWHPGWIPFAEDGAGNLLCIDTVPGWKGTRGQVIHWERTSGPFGGPNRSFHQWLRTYRDDLLGGQRYEVDDEGLINIKP
ncbi:MAG TPA: SMI1/KNR4 family protein [Kofleriaceae bacterium]